MSALARYFSSRALKVYGYDRTPSAITDALIEEGIEISFKDEMESIPHQLLDTIESLQVIYTPAIPHTNKILNFFMERGYSIRKRSEVLGDVTRNSVNIAIGGTHGKTTTSCMVSSIFARSNKNFKTFLGGISADLGSNFYEQVKEGELYTIAEADEFDRSFLRLDPSYEIITSTDADHLDIYQTSVDVLEAYKQFAAKVKDPSKLLHSLHATGDLGGATYSISDPQADYYGEIVQTDAHGSLLNIFQNQKLLVANVRIGLPGIHNAENGLAASVVAYLCGIELNVIQQALSGF